MTFLQFYFDHALQVFTFLWLITAGRSVLFWLHYVQLKQYRLDRLFEAIQQKEFFRLFVSPYRLSVFALFLLWESLVRLKIGLPLVIFQLYFAGLTLFFLLQVIRTVFKLRGHQLQYPTFTRKAWTLFLVTMLFEILLASFYGYWPEQLLAIEILQPIIVFAVFLAAVWPNQFLFKTRLKKASKKILTRPDLTVIGITGSYGKTTMKEYLAHLLAFKHAVLKTPAHMNVDTGVAQIVLSQLQPQHQFFVVEMGAYRVGEIKRICDIVHPQYAVLTGLSNQHLSLFGSLKELEKTKFELVDSVPDDKHIFANADSKPLVRAFSARKREPITFSTGMQADFTPESVEYQGGYTEFRLNGEAYKAPIFGKAQLTNLIGAMAVAFHFGLSSSDLREALIDLPVILGTMQIAVGPKESIFIDDTYNANTEGVLAALGDLRIFHGKNKIIVFDQVIELGEQTHDDHRRIAQHFAKQADKIFLLKSPQRLYMQQVLADAGFPDNRMITSITDLRAQINSQTVVLFEGRAAYQVLDALKTAV